MDLDNHSTCLPRQVGPPGLRTGSTPPHRQAQPSMLLDSLVAPRTYGFLASCTLLLAAPAARPLCRDNALPSCTSASTLTCPNLRFYATVVRKTACTAGTTTPPLDAAPCRYRRPPAWAWVNFVLPRPPLRSRRRSPTAAGRMKANTTYRLVRWWNQLLAGCYARMPHHHYRASATAAARDSARLRDCRMALLTCQQQVQLAPPVSR